MSGTLYTAESIRPPFVWFGGKHQMLDVISAWLPTAEETGVYVEPYLGAGTVFFRKTEIYKVEVVNDLDDRIVNCMRVLQDKTKFDTLEHRLKFTAYAFKEYMLSIDILKAPRNYTDIDFAWALIVNQNFGYSGHGGTTPGDFGRTKGLTSSSRPATFVNRVNVLYKCSEKIKNAIIEHQDGANVIKMYDSQNTIFYIDPPYPTQTRKSERYNCDMNDAQHQKLVEILADIKGCAIVSSYENALYNNLVNIGWRQYKYDVICYSIGSNNNHKISNRERRTESLYISPNLLKLKNRKQSEFDFMEEPLK